jgi:hypothetical protein
MWEYFYVAGIFINAIGLVLYKITEEKITIGDVLAIITLSFFSFFIWPILFVGFLMFGSIGEYVVWRKK